jgi:hypothetical protein
MRDSINLFVGNQLKLIALLENMLNEILDLIFPEGELNICGQLYIDIVF